MLPSPTLLQRKLLSLADDAPLQKPALHHQPQTSTPPESTPNGYDTEAARSRHFVTASSITVVTQDYSLFENPVTMDYVMIE